MHKSQFRIVVKSMCPTYLSYFHFASYYALQSLKIEINNKHTLPCTGNTFPSTDIPPYLNSLNTYLIGHYNYNYINYYKCLEPTPNDRLLWNFSWQIYLFSEFLSKFCWGEVAEEIFCKWVKISLFVFLAKCAYSARFGYDSLILIPKIISNLCINMYMFVRYWLFVFV